MSIRFGTDGWRARIAEDFTFDNVRSVAQAVAGLLRRDGAASGAPVPIGYDVRFLGPRFAGCVASVLKANGIPVILCDGPVTTPMVSCRVVAGQAPLGICITASHNPPDYNGFKVKGAFGGSAPPETTARIEALIGRTPPREAGSEDVERTSFLPAYAPRIAAVVDLPLLRRSGLRVVVDSMHGSGGRVAETLVGRGRAHVETVRGGFDPLFGGVAPEPRPDTLEPLRRAVVARRAHLGIATDGDADRVAACDETGRILSPFQIFALVALHLIEQKKWRGAVARTFANTLVAERIARRHGLPFHDLPIGFKHVAALMRSTDVLIGGEESGGIGVKGYLPERDGILIGLLLMESLTSGERRLSRRIARLEKEYGRFSYRRLDLTMDTARAAEAVARLREAPPDRIGGARVQSIDTLDGVKLLLGDDGWILFRASGTEPLLRIYSEASSAALLERLMRAGAARLRSDRPGRQRPRVAE